MSYLDEARDILESLRTPTDVPHDKMEGHRIVVNTLIQMSIAENLEILVKELPGIKGKLQGILHRR